MDSDKQFERGEEEDMVCISLSKMQTESDIHDKAEAQTESDEGDIHNDI